MVVVRAWLGKHLYRGCVYAYVCYLPKMFHLYGGLVKSIEKHEHLILETAKIGLQDAYRYPALISALEPHFSILHYT